MRTRHNTRGFTLIEIAVVVALIGIMLAAGLKIAGSLFDSAAGTSTMKKQAALKDALVSYLGRNRRLPCPDTGPAGWSGTIAAGNILDGHENRTGWQNGQPDLTTGCASAFGVVPYLDLGLPRDAALDGWQNLFSYAVANIGSANPYAWNMTASYPEANTPARAGFIQIDDRDSAGNALVVSQAGVVAIVSHGRNGNGAFGSGTATGSTQNALPNPGTNPDEYANTSAANPPPGNAAQVFFARQQTDNTASVGGSFDDVVLYLVANDLVYPNYQSNVLQSPLSAANTQLQSARNTVLTAILNQASASGCSTAAASLLTLGNDPWGSPLQLIGLQPVISPLSPTATAFTLLSKGPDGCLGSCTAGLPSDDISLSVSMSDVMAFLIGGTGNASACLQQRSGSP